MKAVLLVVLYALIIAVPSAGANWVQNGVAICTATGNQWEPQITSDGVGGALVTWCDARDTTCFHIYAQSVNASGAIKWTTDGAVLCLADWGQMYPSAMPDGAGGAIIAWMDARSGTYYQDIYAQRVNASGMVQWTTDGVALCTGTHYQQFPQMTSDGAGGAIITWTDDRNGSYRPDIYAQRVNPSGAVLWTANGVPLCTAAWEQSFPTIVSDGAGGAIVTWEDSHNGDFDIYAQRINGSGAVQWAANGVALCTVTADQYGPQICSDGAGGAIVTWEDLRNGGDYDVYAQRVNASGAVQWTTDGVALCAATGTQWYPQITSDGAGGAIVTWQDERSGDYGNYDIYSQRVNASGAVQWVADGVALCTATGSQWNPTIISDGAGGAIITWNDFRGSSWDVYAQRVNVSGAVQWAADGVALCTATDHQWNPRVAPDGVGGAFVTWKDDRNGSDGDIYCQRVDGAGHVAPEIATLLQNYSAALEGTSVRLDWVLSQIDQGVRFSVLRASTPDWNYVELEGATITQDGLSFTVTDGGCLPGSTCKYRVEYGAERVARKALFETDAITIPALPMALYQNYPNPFNPSTAIKYSLPKQSWVHLEVYDHSGRRIASLVDGEQQEGLYTAQWDGRDGRGHSVASGVYFCRLTAGKQTISKKMVLLR